MSHQVSLEEYLAAKARPVPPARRARKTSERAGSGSPAETKAAPAAPVSLPAVEHASASGGPEGDDLDPIAIAIEIVASLKAAEREMAALAGELASGHTAWEAVAAEARAMDSSARDFIRRRDGRAPPPAPADEEDFGSRLVRTMQRASARADVELAELRELHAEILGCPIEELDARVEAQKAEERRAREEAKAARSHSPPQPGRGRRARQPAPSVEVIEAAKPPVERLTDRQRDLLRLVRVEGNVAVYTGADHIPDWSELKRVLVTLGGAWRTGGKSKPGGFHFADDVDALGRVRLALEAGEILDLDAAGFFPTPDAIADQVVALAELRDDDVVLEPSAGRGAIVRAIKRARPAAKVVVVELLPDNIRVLCEVAEDIVERDFLAVEPREIEVSACVMNPPFAKRADIAHVRHALRCIAPGGPLVSIMSAGVLYRDDALARAFRDEIAALGGRFEELPEGAFKESGTMVRTCVCVVPRSCT